MKKVANNMEKKLFNFRPMLFAAIFLILGIVYAYYRKFYALSAWWLFAASPLFAWVLFAVRKWVELVKRIGVLLVLIAFFAVGAICFYAQINSHEQSPRFDGEYTVTGTVEARCDRGKTVQLRLTDITIAEKEVKGRLEAYMPYANAKNMRIADKVVLSGKVRTDHSCFNKYGFDDSGIRDKLRYQMTGEGGSVVGRSTNLFLLVRSRVQEVVYASMDETPAAFTLALLTGDTSGIEEGVNANMQYGGISHIFAVSGLNVGALYLFCLFLFLKTPMRRTPKAIRFIVLALILYLYCGVCGFTASVVRAAILSGVLYFCQLLGTGSDMLNGLGTAAILILLLSPCELFGAGFQLSFLACLGLVLLTKRIGHVFDELYNAFRERHPKRYSEEEREMLSKGDTLPDGVGTSIRKGAVTLLSASIAAQMTTLPALIAHFGYLSGWSLLLNFIFVPFTDGIFTILLVVTAIACLLPSVVGKVLLFLPSLVWSMGMLVFEVADFSGFALKNVQVSWIFSVCYYGGVFLLSDKLNVKASIRYGLAILVFVAALAAFLVRNL